ncbi:hypothetical protein PGC35_18665 [Psychrobacillus sp. PGGUH221]|uniref:hypothetical protein n=1 Tax=Psychrobacillus sp. PGGUH221 TaxID=3020058 RepID=UPI0035C774F1
MKNNFITYLNTMNNANSSNENAIAESQITNPYYESIRVERKIGQFLIECMKEKPVTILLTGHAGDGKTSLIYQILRDLNLIQVNEQLKISDKMYSEKLESSFYYVKDMSELNKEEQVNFLKKGLDIKKEKGSAIIISNTGPLIDAFKGLEDKEKSVELDSVIEMDLLELMDSNEGKMGKVGNHEVLVINMARIDNTILVPQLLNRILKEELWEPCSVCDHKLNCSIYNNYQTLKENTNNVNTFITSFYRWLYETDKRLTVRQILAHLTYSITGNLNCDTTLIDNKGANLFKYHFSNLFFGYQGTEENSEALQIRAIKEIKNLMLDSKELTFDYEIFVKNDFSFLTPLAQNVISPYWKKKMHKYTSLSMDLLKREEPYKLRKAVRRMEMLFGKHTEDTMNLMLGNIYTNIYPTYLEMRKKSLSVKNTRDLKNKIIQALYFMFIGVAKKDEKSIYLPLSRTGNGTQNVQVLLGKIDLDEITILQKFKESKFDVGENHYELVITFRAIDEEFPISLMLLDYFDKVSNGAVSTKLNPALSHGVGRMKSKIYKKYRYRSSDKSIKLLVHTVKGTRYHNLEIEQQELFVD